MNLSERHVKEFYQEFNSITKPNLMVVGGTGVGKSSLINKVFGEEIAKVGTGKPVTKGCVKYTKDNFPVAIFDTEGYEIKPEGADNSNFQSEVISEVERRKSLELKEQIHIFWYCISVANHRITDYDINNILLLNSLKVRLSIVLTKCDEDALNDNDEGVNATTFRKTLIESGINNQVFETAVRLDEKLGLDDLISWSTENLLTDDLKDAWIGAQRSNIPIKDKQARFAIKAAAAAATTAGVANPMPLSDALFIVPIQMTLAARLAVIYGFGALDASVVTLLKGQVLTLIGRQMAASLTKLIPVLGQVINGAVAGLITGGIGYALMTAYRMAYLEMLETGKAPDWANIFSKLDLQNIIHDFKKRGGTDSL